MPCSAIDSYGLDLTLRQDAFAIASYQKAQAATASKAFADEIVPVEIPGARGKPGKIVETDDEVANVGSFFYVVKSTLTASDSSILKNSRLSSRPLSRLVEQ